MATRKIRINDPVKILAGKHKNEIGNVKSIDWEAGKVIVSNINLKKKSIRPNPQANQQGGHKMIEKPIDYSNVALYDSQEKKIVKVGVKVVDGKRVRFNKKTDKLIDIEVK